MLESASRQFSVCRRAVLDARPGNILEKTDLRAHAAGRHRTGTLFRGLKSARAGLQPGRPHTLPRSADTQIMRNSTWAEDCYRGRDREAKVFSGRFPFITVAVGKLPVRSCLIDGEAVVCDKSGLAVFELIRRHGPFTFLSSWPRVILTPPFDLASV